MLQDKNLVLVGIFAVAMAYLESAVVVYLRAMYGIEDLLRDINFKPDVYTFIELGREAATIIMLVMVALIAGNSRQKKLGYFFFSFSIWDIFYYIWLFIFIRWPKSLFEWDVLFLIPLPWWGPVISPILISILLFTIGYLLIKEYRYKITLLDWTIISVSIVLLLYTFVEDSIKIILSGNGDLTSVLPTTFNWPIFIVSYLAWVIITVKVFFPSLKK
jgi:hypothetical protein